MSLTSLGLSAGGMLAGRGSATFMDALALVCALSAFVFICSIEARLSS